MLKRNSPTKKVGPRKKKTSGSYGEVNGALCCLISFSWAPLFAWRSLVTCGRNSCCAPRWFPNSPAKLPATHLATRNATEWFAARWETGNPGPRALAPGGRGRGQPTTRLHSSSLCGFRLRSVVLGTIAEWKMDGA